jgi:hypothetical protein
VQVLATLAGIYRFYEWNKSERWIWILEAFAVEPRKISAVWQAGIPAE